MKKMLILIVLVVTLMATPVMAKEGFFIGAFFIPTEKISGDFGQGLDSGSGYGFKAGLGFNKYFSIEGVLERSNFDVKGGGASVELDGLAVDLRINFPLTTLDSAKIMSFEPYVLFGYGTYDAESGSQSFSGNGPRVGIGIEQYLFRELSVNVGYTATRATFDTKPEEDGTIRTFEVGLIYHFL